MLKAHLSIVENIWLPFKEQNLIKTITVSCFWAKLLDCFRNTGFPVFLSVQKKSKTFKPYGHICLEDSEGGGGGCCWAENALFRLQLPFWHLSLDIKNFDFFFIFMWSTDAQDRELLAQHSITHILSIHDMAAPVLEVRQLQTGLPEWVFAAPWPKPWSTYRVHNFFWTQSLTPKCPHWSVLIVKVWNLCGAAVSLQS